MDGKRISLFPLSGAILFPGMHLPLHVFEDRYRALINDAMARDRQIGMVQPKSGGNPPPLFNIGCVGKIIDIEALEDGCFNIVLQGIARFHIQRELDVTTAFRQVEARVEEPSDMEEVLASAERAALEMEARKFAQAQGYQVDWESINRLDDNSFVNGIAQIAPFDAASKQALLEVDGLSDRSELIIQMLHFFGKQDGPADRPTMQ